MQLVRCMWPQRWSRSCSPPPPPAPLAIAGDEGGSSSALRRMVRREIDSSRRRASQRWRRTGSRWRRIWLAQQLAPATEPPTASVGSTRPAEGRSRGQSPPPGPPVGRLLALHTELHVAAAAEVVYLARPQPAFGVERGEECRRASRRGRGIEEGECQQGRGAPVREGELAEVARGGRRDNEWEGEGRL
jgi:hypothetical protein